MFSKYVVCGLGRLKVAQYGNRMGQGCSGDGGGDVRGDEDDRRDEVNFM